MLYRSTISIYSEGMYYSTIMTENINKAIKKSQIKEGIVAITLRHTTSCLMLLEHEVGILVDIKAFIERILPSDITYHHHIRGVDTNGKGHVLNALFNSNLVVPVIDGALSLGEFQDVVFLDFQEIAKDRDIEIFIYGDSHD